MRNDEYPWWIYVLVFVVCLLLAWIVYSPSIAHSQDKICETICYPVPGGGMECETICYPMKIGYNWSEVK